MSEDQPGVPLWLDIGVLDMATYEEDFEIGVTDLHMDDATFLRRMSPTDAEGMMEIKTVFPGFYVGRAIHIHVHAYTDWTPHDNGTVSSGNVVSTDQMYFKESLSSQIMALEPYSLHTEINEINRTTNAVDSLFAIVTNGYNPIVSIVPVDGENVENGMIGYITMGIDTTANGIDNSHPSG